MVDTCRLCNSSANLIFRQTILRKHDVAYFQCPACDLIQTEKPHWLAESYDDAVAILDTGAMDRNLLCRDLIRVLAWLLRIGPDARCLDYGAGIGVLVRLMRDAGFDFRWADKFATNSYARGFEGDVEKPHDLVTAFEVFEHFDEVGPEIRRLFAPGHHRILVSTFLHRGHRDNWWYYVPEVGQHIAFYSRQTMAWIAKQYGYHALCGPAFTLFVRPQCQPLGWRGNLVRRILNRHRYRQAQSPWVRLLLRWIPEHPWLIESDQAMLKERQASPKPHP